MEVALRSDLLTLQKNILYVPIHNYHVVFVRYRKEPDYGDLAESPQRKPKAEILFIRTESEWVL